MQSSTQAMEVQTVLHLIQDVLEDVAVADDSLPSLMEQLKVLLQEELNDETRVRLHIVHHLLQDQSLDLYEMISVLEMTPTVQLYLSLLDDEECWLDMVQQCIAYDDLQFLESIWDQVVRLEEELFPTIWFTTCRKGSLQMIQWIWEKDVTRGLEEEGLYRSLEQAIRNGLEATKWVYTQLELDHHYHDELAFRLACTCSLEVAQWIYSLGGVDHHVLDDCIWKRCASRGPEDVLHWVYGLGVSDEAIQASMNQTMTEGRLDSFSVLIQLTSVDPNKTELLDRVLEDIVSGHTPGLHKRQDTTIAPYIHHLIRAGANLMICEGLRETRPDLYRLLQSTLSKRSKSARGSVCM